MTEGVKYDSGKRRWDLLPTESIDPVIDVITYGASKYSDHNWKNVSPFFDRYYAATIRHLMARKAGEITDQESGLPHLAHAATNILFMIYGDDKRIDIRQKNVGIDIDEVIADFAEFFIEYYCKDKSKVDRSTYGLYPDFKLDFKDSLNNQEFWLSIPKLADPSDLFFKPVCYISNRKIPVEWTQDWLEFHGFPIAPVIHTSDKGKAAREMKVDIFIDDLFSNFIEITDAGTKCLLFDRPHNQKYEVGNLRIKSLKEIV